MVGLTFMELVQHGRNHLPHPGKQVLGSRRHAGRRGRRAQARGHFSWMGYLSPETVKASLVLILDWLGNDAGTLDAALP